MKISSFLLDLVFPNRCLNCELSLSGGEALCGECYSRIAKNQTLFCGRCMNRLPTGKKICHREHLYRLGAAADYHDSAVKNLIHGLKFRFVRNAAKPLGGLLADYLIGLPISLTGFAIMPIPLGTARERTRGFNQSELIAQELAHRLALPLLMQNLRRVQNTRPQSELGTAERRLNVRDCFAVERPRELKNARILLVDDVTTSGATFFYAAHALKGAGVRTIIALAAARA